MWIFGGWVTSQGTGGYTVYSTPKSVLRQTKLSSKLCLSRRNIEHLYLKQETNVDLFPSPGT